MIITKEIHNKVLLKGACKCPEKLGTKIENIAFDNLLWADGKILTEDQLFDICMDFAKKHQVEIRLFNIKSLLPLMANNGYGNGDGYGYGNGDGYGYGNGDGDGYGNGDGNGYGNSDGNGYGNSDGNGYGNSDGNGYGNGDGDGYGNGDGNGYGNGDGDGYGSLKNLIL